MNQAEVKVMSIALLMVSEIGKKSRNPFASEVKVPWRSFDALADALREAGAEFDADNLGAEAREREAAALARSKQRSEEFSRNRCSTCGRPLNLDPSRKTREGIVASDGEPYCNDHNPDQEVLDV